MARGLELERTPQARTGRSQPRATPMNDTASPLRDPRQEVLRVLDAADGAGVALRAVGGLAVYHRCPSARVPPLARDYKDIDLVGRAGDAARISELMARLGYAADEEFNALHGHRRLYFWDAAHERQLDVFIETLVMSHELVIGERLELDTPTLTPADLLLTKLQVVEVNDKDLKDATALLADHDIEPGGIDPGRVTALLTADWGWWRTATATLERVADYAASLDGFEGVSRVRARAAELRRRVDDAPKSRRWRLRARVGERVRWYQIPEEPDA
jgi:hypothetical protein